MNGGIRNGDGPTREGRVARFIGRGASGFRTNVQLRRMPDVSGGAAVQAAPPRSRAGWWRASRVRVASGQRELADEALELLRGAGELLRRRGNLLRRGRGLLRRCGDLLGRGRGLRGDRGDLA